MANAESIDTVILLYRNASERHNETVKTSSARMARYAINTDAADPNSFDIPSSNCVPGSSVIGVFQNTARSSSVAATNANSHSGNKMTAIPVNQHGMAEYCQPATISLSLVTRTLLSHSELATTVRMMTRNINTTDARRTPRDPPQNPSR